jgi:hypothetical protein
MVRIPVECTAEFRGLARKAGEFTDRETGELVQYGPLLRFEVEIAGVTSELPVRSRDLDNASPAIDYSGLAKADTVKLGGYVQLADRGSGRESYFVVETLVREGVPRAAKAA